MSKTRHLSVEERVIARAARTTKKAVVWSKAARRERKALRSELAHTCRTQATPDMAY